MKNENLYYIWSNEHKSYWMPACCGYTPEKERAGKYSLKEAEEICVNANKYLGEDDIPSETIVPIF